MALFISTLVEVWGESLPDSRSVMLSGESISQHASLLVSILIRYNEIDSIRFRAGKAQLSFSFMVRKHCNEDDIYTFKRMLISYLDTYTHLSGQRVGHLSVVSATLGEYTQIEVTRDVESLTREELSLIISLIRQHFDANLVIEADVALRDDERLLQEELIDDILDDVREGGPRHEIVGFRESGRVMVFTKNRSTN
jgi:hypothetical protein